MSFFAMNMTTASEALEVARGQGFIEATFRPIYSADAVVERDLETDPIAVWGRECDTAGQHALIVGELPDAYFVMLLLGAIPSDMESVLDEMRDLFRRHFAIDPRVDDEVPDELVWTSPKTTRETAVAVALELRAIDRRVRGPDLESG